MPVVTDLHPMSEEEKNSIIGAARTLHDQGFECQSIETYYQRGVAGIKIDLRLVSPSHPDFGRERIRALENGLIDGSPV